MVEPERRTRPDKFVRDLPPILTVAPGDGVVYRTNSAQRAQFDGYLIAGRASLP